MQKNMNLRSTVFEYSFVLIALIFSGWIAVYPYGGYINLFLIFLILALAKFDILKHFIFISLSILVTSYLLFPREFGNPNTAWFLSFYSFLLLIYLTKDQIFSIFEKYINTIIFLCYSALFIRFIVFFLTFPYIFVDLDPQFFKLYWPFHVERINISTAATDALIGSFRFHGPFFEPGAIGYVIGICLFGAKNKFTLFSLVFFGFLSLSFAFFFLLFFFLFERFVNNKNYTPILIGIFIAISLYLLLDQDSFIYQSTFGRLLGDSDKVLDTRNSVFEAEQIQLFKELAFENQFNLLFGVGHDLPGSGGSYRVWFMSTGILLSILYFIFFGYILESNKMLDLNKIFFRLVSLAILFYILGNWLSIIFIFLFCVRSSTISDKNKI